MNNTRPVEGMISLKKNIKAKPPLISIITVVYNGEKYLEQTIISVLGQNYSDYEFIVVDGGSKDGTLNILNKYKGNIDILISEKDNGIYDAMNKGAKLASGEYVFYLNAGDTVFGDTFKKIFEVNDSSLLNAQIIYGDIINSTSKLLIKGHVIEKIKSDMAFCHQAVIVKRELQNEFAFDTSYKIAADYNFFLKMYRHSITFLYVEVIFGEFDDSGVSNTKFFNVFGEYIKIIWRNSEGYSKLTEVVNYLFLKKKFIAYLLLLKVIGPKKYQSMRSLLRQNI